MKYLADCLASLGLTRDNPIWTRLQIVTLATLITSGVFDVAYWAAYIGIPWSELATHRLRALAIIVLFFAGKLDTSPLKGAPKGTV